MQKSVKVIVIAFLIVMLILFLYQTLIGNPFFDEVHPYVVLGGFLLMAILSIIAIIRDRRENSPQESQRKIKK